MFDPPLSRWEKRIGWAWMITGGTAAAAMWLGISGWLIFLVVTLPFMLFAMIAPGLFLYMSAIIVPLLLTRGRLRPLGWAVAVLLVAVLAAWRPWQSARHVDFAQAAAVADDFGDPVAMPRGGTVALLGGMDESCGPLCRDLLLRHGAAAVLIEYGRLGYPVTPRPLPRLRLVPSAGKPCRPAGQNARAVDWVDEADARVFAAAGWCAVVDTALLTSADLVLRVADDFFGPAQDGISVIRAEAWRRQGGRLQPVLRRTYAVGWPVRFPALYQAPVSDDSGTHSAGWARRHDLRGTPISDDLSVWLRLPA